MSFVPRCPRCGGDVEIVFLAPGDKAARCDFCNLVVDLPDGETRNEVSEEEVRPDGTRVVRHVVSSQSDGVAPNQHEQLMKSLRGQLERAAGASPEHADEIFQALGELESGGATVKVVKQSQVVSGTELSGVPADMRNQMAQAFASLGMDQPTAAAESRMHVQWSDGQRYPCTVVERRGEQCLVEFGDGTRRWVPAAAVVPAS